MDLSRPKRQPNLVFAAARWHGVTAPGPYSALRSAMLADDGTIERTIRGRATQTRPAARCAAAGDVAGSGIDLHPLDVTDADAEGLAGEPGLARARRPAGGAPDRRPDRSGRPDPARRRRLDWLG